MYIICYTVCSNVCYTVLYCILWLPCESGSASYRSFLAFFCVFLCYFYLFIFLSFLPCFLLLFLCYCWSFKDVPLIFSCPAGHVVVPDWQPRILLGMVEARSVNVKNTHTHTLIPPWEDQCEWHRMTRMTGPDCAVMCNLINTHTHTHTYRRYFQHAPFIPIVGVGKRGEY